jgi:hypothetical protein
MRFRLGMRVLVTGGDEELIGKTGTVVRLLTRNPHEAWVALNGEMPKGSRVFPANDEHGRGNHVTLYDDEVVESEGVTS